MKRSKVIIVEDESIIAFELKMKLQRYGYDVVTIVRTGKEAIDAVMLHEPDVTLMEIVLQGDMDGIEAATRIKEKRNIPIIYVTTSTYLKSSERLIASKPFGMLMKPIVDEKLFEMLEQAVAANL